jgi:hypothetical protein
MEDFIFEENKTEDNGDFEYIVKLVPVSEKAINEFGKCVIGSIILLKESDTMALMHKRFPVLTRHNSIILEMVRRHDDCDKDRKVKHIAGKMLCQIIKKLELDIKYIYLYAISAKLISLYKSLGFSSINPENPLEMVAEISEIERKCSDSPQLYNL